ncbi:serine hydrolase domain-containing protein [Vitreimonas flagellata]|uniref:serine hydrolase domain-containing protein n=1 Tax=Vitreimonas flagellata TaxID=2560861 RepID=UPI001075488A|nr:serine hydrolase domain-containing protein [Vitreimonas flagellata]
MRNVLASLAFLTSALASAHAQDLPALEPANVQAWADRHLGAMVENGGASGVVVSVVRGGEIIYEGGYGLGDVVAQTPADPVATRVRIGSNTKTFTATLIAQLMDEGRIASLDDPANRYLQRYQLPPNGQSPILLRHLLTHTAGYSDRFFFIGADRPVDIPVSAQVFDRLRPSFARPVEEQVVYSNFGVATLGLVIEDLTDAPIDEAMRTRLFEPFGMTQTELATTIEAPSNLARPGLIAAGGRIVGPTPFTAINPAVAQTGSIVSTAHDMALYMNAQLGHGDLLSAEARGRLRQRLAANAAEGAGVAMVFIEDSWAGRQTISHGGNWAGFHSWFTLAPDEDVGVFVAIIGEAAPVGMWDRLRGAIHADWAPPPSPAVLSASGATSAFMSEFFGAKRAFVPVTISAEDLAAYAGFYRADRRPYTTSERLSALTYFGADVVELSVGEGGLYLNGAGPWAPQGDGRFMLDAPTRPQIIIRPNPRTGEFVLTPDIGLYTMTRIDDVAHPKLHAILAHLLAPLALLGLLAPLTLGRTWRAWPPILVGLGAAGVIGASLVGLGAGESLMTGYFAGHVGRIGVLVASADIMLLAGLGCVWGAITASGAFARIWLALIASIALVFTGLLALYGGVALGVS